MSSVDDTAAGLADGSDASPATLNGCPELRELRYFVAAAEDLHFTRAAQRLHIAQQALSSAIRQLEARLGTPLFERTTRQVRLTAAGDALLPKARQALTAAEEAATAARDAGRGVTGRLTIGVSCASGTFGFAVLRAMQAQAPGVELTVRHDFVQPLVEALGAGDLDAAFVFCPEYRSYLGYQRLAEEQAIAVMHPAHRLADRTELWIADLAGEILTVSGPGMANGYDAAVLALCQREGVTPRIVQSTGFLGPPGLAPGASLGIVTQTALEGVHTDFELARIPIHGARLPFDLAWHRDRHSPLIATLRRVAACTATASRWPGASH